MAIEIEVPQYSIEAQQLDADTIVLMLVASSSGQQAKLYLCEVSQNYQQIAKKLHDNICEAGAQGRRAKSGLITVTDLPDALKGGFNGKGTVR